MYCKYCKVNVEGKSDVCPLCHSPLENDQTSLAFCVPKTKVNAKTIASRTLLLVFFALSIVSIVANLLVLPEVKWSGVIVSLLLFIFVFIRFDVFNRTNFRMSVFIELVMLTFIFNVVKLLFLDVDHVVFSYILPVAYFLALGIFLIYIICTKRFAPKNLITTILLGFMCIIPLITALVYHLYLVPSYVVASIGLINIIISLVVGKKHLTNEFRKFFHK